MNLRTTVPHEKLPAFCERWGIRELALFGSVVRDDFGPESDVDVLVRFKEDARPTLFDLVRAQNELAVLFGRDVDLVDRRSIERSRNRIRREAVLSEAVVIHAA
jgi:predicted nucleotidyltransferase